MTAQVRIHDFYNICELCDITGSASIRVKKTEVKIFGYERHIFMCKSCAEKTVSTLRTFFNAMNYEVNEKKKKTDVMHHHV